MEEQQATLLKDGSTETVAPAGLTRQLIMPGKPMTWARVRAGRHGQFFTPDDRRNRMAQIGIQWKARHPRRYDKDLPLAMTIVFVFDRPKSHFGTGRNAGVLKHDARQLRPGGGAGGGDIDNLGKLVLDSLNGVAFHDDRQIAELVLSKRYVRGTEKPHTSIEIQPVF